MTEHVNTYNITAVELEVMSVIQDEKGMNWYDRVYLCYEDTNFKPPTTYGAIKGFDCYRYNSFKNATIGWDNKTELHAFDVRHTMIPMCRWVPEILDKYILGWKLQNMYWGGQICMGRGYNKFK